MADFSQQIPVSSTVETILEAEAELDKGLVVVHKLPDSRHGAKIAAVSFCLATQLTGFADYLALLDRLRDGWGPGEYLIKERNPETGEIGKQKRVSIAPAETAKISAPSAPAPELAELRTELAALRERATRPAFPAWLTDPAIVLQILQALRPAPAAATPLAEILAAMKQLAPAPAPSSLDSLDKLLDVQAKLTDLIPSGGDDSMSGITKEALGLMRQVVPSIIAGGAQSAPRANPAPAALPAPNGEQPAMQPPAWVLKQLVVAADEGADPTLWADMALSLARADVQLAAVLEQWRISGPDAAWAIVGGWPGIEIRHRDWFLAVWSAIVNPEDSAPPAAGNEIPSKTHSKKGKNGNAPKPAGNRLV